MWAKLEENMNAKSIKREGTTLQNTDICYIPEQLTEELQDLKQKNKELESQNTELLSEN